MHVHACNILCITSNYYHKGNAAWVQAYESLRLLLNTKRKMVDIGANS